MNDVNDVNDPRDFPWRIGRRVGRTVYYDDGSPNPNDGSKLIGVMDTPELAVEAVAGHNALLRARREAGNHR